jgi:alanine or glycine:cation symporter, AGCS family
MIAIIVIFIQGGLKWKILFWSPALVYLCLATGLFYSLLTRFLQVRHLKEMIKQIFQGKSSEAGISSFQALSLALSGRVGTGNIAGVATAIAYGGPGAVFWMWLIAFVGAGSAFVEAGPCTSVQNETGWPVSRRAGLLH